MAKKILFAGAKGGTGTTTVCVGLGFALAKAGERTLIVDGDSLGGSGLAVAGLQNMQVYTLADYGRGACRAKQAAIPHPKCDRLQIMCSLGVSDKKVAERAVGEIEGLYDYILLDKICAGLCDCAVIVTDPYLPSVKCADGVRSRLYDGGIKDVTLIVNKLNGGQVACGEVYSAEQTAQLLRLKLTAAMPEDMFLPCGKMKARTIKAFDIAAAAIMQKSGDVYDVLSGYTGINGAIKRRLRAKL